MAPAFNPFDFGAPASTRRAPARRRSPQQKQPRRGAAQKPPRERKGGRLDGAAALIGEIRRGLAGRLALA